MAARIRREGRAGLPRICRDHEPPARERAVAAIGNFDGVHLGHRRLIEAARELAGGARPIAVLTFEPHPRAFFRPDEPAFRLTPEPLKYEILGALGVELVYVRRFDAALAATGAADFVSGVVAGQLGISGVVVGEDFHFGRGREGTPEVLRSLAEANGLEARIEPAVEVEGAPVSSSRIRAALERGEVEVANRLLGYRWLVRGEVVHGAKRGRTLGFPTANVALDPGCRLAHGIYAVRVATADGAVRGGVASFGRRPTFDDGPPLLETFIFDFARDLYGQEIEVEFVGWIRGEERFASAEALVERMRRDAERAQEMIPSATGSQSFLA